MAGILTSATFLERYGEQLRRAAAAAAIEAELITLSTDPDARLSDEDCERIEIACYSLDLIDSPWGRSFFSSLYRAPRLSWLHTRNAGVDHPIFGRFLERGVMLTTSAGAAAEPIAQSTIAGLLTLSRGFPEYADAQRRHAWEQADEDARPDLLDQTLVVFGLGAIGSAIARIAQAIGLRVVGVRRSPAREGDPVDELRHPDELPSLLPRADWLALACPLTPETRGLFNASVFAAMPSGAHVLNIARGPVVDEPALIEALQSGQLGGAYLDVFEEEPLPGDSPLWDMPRVIVTPHNSGASSGNDPRSAAIFFDNLGRWARGEPLRNIVREAGE